ncbi:hypothetical protein [Methylomonas sp. 11b]|uniref:hypothetical protein n=1 Tax=Methylomonas sp. 11b TaxID=1168169 RepID=UPI0004792813|nr:hypothetical protein [Methylomonas sp. 11b]
MNKFEIDQIVWIVVNPLHMETVENDPVIKGKLEGIRRFAFTNREGTKETIKYLVDTLWFEREVDEQDLFGSKADAVQAAKALINNIRANRLKTDQKLDEAYAAIGTDRE